MSAFQPMRTSGLGHTKSYQLGPGTKAAYPGVPANRAHRVANTTAADRAVAAESDGTPAPVGIERRCPLSTHAALHDGLVP